jgi:hypothetical protein
VQLEWSSRSIHANETKEGAGNGKEWKGRRSINMELKRNEMRKGKIKTRKGKEIDKAIFFFRYRQHSRLVSHIHKGNLRNKVIRGEVM